MARTLAIKGPSRGIGRGIDDGGDYAIVENGQIIADVIYRTGPTTYQDALANARLFAAAPRLIAALNRVPIVERRDTNEGPPFSLCKGCGATDGNDCTTECWVWELENALAWAETGQPLAPRKAH